MAESVLEGKIKHFAVDLLGCGCPDEVFKSIEVDSLKLFIPSQVDIRRIVIGNRLLIYLMSIEEVGSDPARMISLLNQGQQERDGKGYNRLRVVLYKKNDDCDSSSLQQIFLKHAGLDDRLFLHILEESEVADILEK